MSHSPMLIRPRPDIHLTGLTLDRDPNLRADAAALRGVETAENARFLAIWRGQVLVTKPETGAPAPLWLSRQHSIFEHSEGPSVFLGGAGDQGYFAIDVSTWNPAQDPAQPEDAPRPPGTSIDAGFHDLRRVYPLMTAQDAAALGAARAVLQWQRSHRFCGRCGGDMRAIEGGWKLSCDACGRDSFPRTDPVVIMLITYENQVLLARSPGWPEAMYSLIAGFMEPGESLEEAVRRETQEETGLALGDVTYLASQPWPFPGSLMLGCHAEAQGTALSLDPAELEDALWVSRETCMAAMAGHLSHIRPARQGTIAHSLLTLWLQDRLI